MSGKNVHACFHCSLLGRFFCIRLRTLGRVHRIGQCRPVQVVRYIIRDTVEARVRQLQDKKRRLACHGLTATADADSEAPGAESAGSSSVTLTTFARSKIHTSSTQTAVLSMADIRELFEDGNTPPW